MKWISTISAILIFITAQTSKWFKKAYEARKAKHQSVEKGRQWVDVYVKYITFIHGLYKTIEKGPKHGVGD
jgi:hypothetical protein